MTSKKTIFLFLALLLPVCIFIFLKMFGRNEFTVAARFQEGEIPASENCPYSYSTPYVLPDSVFSPSGVNRNDSLYVFYFDPAMALPLRRISAEFDSALVQVVPAERLHGNSTDTLLKECVFLIRGDSSVALVDNRKRIRGYYVGDDRDEVDRLVVEMKIILKQY